MDYSVTDTIKPGLTSEIEEHKEYLRGFCGGECGCGEFGDVLGVWRSTDHLRQGLRHPIVLFFHLLVVMRFIRAHCKQSEKNKCL